MKTQHSPAARKDRESNNSMTQQNELPAEDGPTKRTKRKASPKETSPRKRTKVSEPGPQSHREESLCSRYNLRGDREGQSSRKRKRSLDENDKETSSSSVDTSSESSSNLSDSCIASQKHVSKRKAIAAGAGPNCKRTRRAYLKVTKTEYKKETLKVSTMETKKEIIKEIKKEIKKKTLKETIKETEKGITKETINKSVKETIKETIKESKLDSRVDALRAEFQAKYQQQDLLGAGGCGSVFAGYRRADELPVAIKYIPQDLVLCKHVDKKGRQLSVEVAIMLKLAGTSAPVSLLDWYDLDLELILVMERPVPAIDLYDYIKANGGSLSEEKAKIILKQLVDAAKDLEERHIFHRDIKVENILIETGSDVPRVRLIDFGLGCFVKKGSLYRIFYGTADHVPPEWNSHYTYRAGPSTVWQMGVVLFDSLHGVFFETTKFLRKKLRIKNKVSKDCQDFLQSCLTKSPKQRPTLDQLRLHPWLN